MLFLLVTTAFAAKCADKAFVLPAKGYAYGVKTAGTGYKAAKCATGVFTASTANSANVMQTAADIQALLKTKDPRNFAANEVKCATGYTGTAAAECATATSAPTAKGCTAKAAPAANKNCLVAPAAGNYPEVAAGMTPGQTKEVTCKASIKPAKAKGTATCNKSATAAKPTFSGCYAATWVYPACPIPAKGSAASEVKPACNGAACTGAEPTKKKVACTAAAATATNPQCDVTGLWAANAAKGDKRTAASCAKTAKKALGTTVAGCTCTQKCKTGKTSANTATADYTCKTVADTDAYWKCAAPKKAGAAGSSASGVSMIAAAVFGVLSYAL